jgi:PIN domain nuclease of toxin-antitoxin system
MIIENTENQCVVSIISLYEIAIKKNIGKLNTENSISIFQKEIDNVGLELLPITVNHLEKYTDLPQISNHKDPFDRLIIATAITENFIIITSDEKFKTYQDLLNVVW